MRMTRNAREFDDWIRGPFVELNTGLEEIYFEQSDRTAIPEAGARERRRLVEEGERFVTRLLREGNTDEGFDSAFDVLGNLGMYMAACRRHGITDPDREPRSPLKNASALAMHLGASLGVTPRFATSHLTTHNPAREGRYKRFTALEAEMVFFDYNTRAILAYKRAADALARTLPLGISHPITCDLLRDARAALEDVARWNAELFERLEVDRFFYCVRPYFKPHRVGLHIYRGANAGDFAGINEIDLLLGLCRADNPEYSQLLVDKFLYMLPEDQLRLRDTMRRRSLLDELLEAMPGGQSTPWFQQVTRVFLEVCEAHGHTAAQHHNQLVEKFIAHPAKALPEEEQTDVTASGPPLSVLLPSLEKLRDLRCAAERDDIPSRYRELRQLRSSLMAGFIPSRLEARAQ